MEKKGMVFEGMAIEAGDKVTVNGVDGLFTVQCVGTVDGRDQARLIGRNDWFDVKSLHLEYKLEQREERVVARIKDGKVVELNV